MTSIFHLVLKDEWEAAKHRGEYWPIGSKQSFIHCSFFEQVLISLRKHFVTQEGLIVLEIALDAVRDRIKVEANIVGGAKYPHLYRALSLHEVTAIHALGSSSTEDFFTASSLGRDGGVILPHGTTRYRDTVRLRELILRKPLGLKFSEEELLQESDSLHLGWYEDGILVGCLVLKPVSTDNIQMRQVAVEPRMQGKGIGRKLIEFSELIARERGYTTIILHARETAVPFYTKHNYQKQGVPFIEVTIPHWQMYKNL